MYRRYTSSGIAITPSGRFKTPSEHSKPIWILDLFSIKMMIPAWHTSIWEYLLIGLSIQGDFR